MYEKLAEETNDVIFLSVDVDEVDDLTNEMGINAMPTFQFYKNNNRLSELKGADIEKLKELVQTYK